MKNTNVEDADKILRRLSDEGYFGETAKDLNLLRDNVDDPVLIYKSALSIINTDYGNNKLIYKISDSLDEIYVNSIKANGQKTIDILTEFLVGTEENPEYEHFTNYKNYVIENEKLKRQLYKLTNKKSLLYSDKINFGNDCASHYSSTIEFISKILIPLIQIDLAMVNKKEITNIMKMPTSNKLNYLKQSKNFDWSFLVPLVDKNIRNAESHLDFSYNPESGSFIGKYWVPKKKKYINIDISCNEFLGKIIKNAEAIVLGFFLSIFLLYLSMTDVDKARYLHEQMCKQG